MRFEDLIRQSVTIFVENSQDRRTLNLGIDAFG